MSVETVQEKEWIVSLVSSLGKRRRRQYWTSGNDIEVEGRWEWAKRRTRVPQFGWSEEPFNSPGENCLAWTVDIKKTGANGDFWQGSSCCNNLRYICEL